MMSGKREAGNVLKGIVAGVVGGLAAAWTMNQFQAAWGKRAEGVERPHGAQSLQQGTPQHGVGRELQARGNEEEEDDAAVRAASVISERVFEHHLTKSEKETGGALAHYAMGVTAGAIYGGVAEVFPRASVGAGVPFGAAVWLIADEGIVPALGLSKDATEYPLSIHAYALTSHLVFGLTAEIVRSAVRRIL